VSADPIAGSDTVRTRHLQPDLAPHGASGNLADAIDKAATIDRDE
jgi:hypothetical protein